jgi:hypothetical protein
MSRRTTRRLATFCSAPLLVAGCWSALTSTDDLDREYGSSLTPQGGEGGAPGEEGGAGGDGGQAGGGGQGGAPVVEGKVEDCAPLPPDAAQWIKRGSATNFVDLELTPDDFGVTGGVWWSVPKNFAEFDVSFEFNVFPQWNSTSGLGLAFVWVTGPTPPGEVTSYKTFGLPQRAGWALVFDTFPAVSPAYPSFFILNGSNGALATGNDLSGSQDAREFAPGVAPPDKWNLVTLRIRKEGTPSELLYGAKSLISPQLTYRGIQGVFGFTASNEELNRKSQFSVRNVRMFLPYDGGCVR